MKLGTAFSYVATPFARAFGLPCIDPVTGGLRPDSTCAKVRDALDEGRWRDAAYDFVWRKHNTESETDNMNGEVKTLKEWVIVHQMAVHATTWQEAMSQMEQADTLAVTVQLRQQQPTLSGPVRPPPQLMKEMPTGEMRPASEVAAEATKSEKK